MPSRVQAVVDKHEELVYPHPNSVICNTVNASIKLGKGCFVDKATESLCSILSRKNCGSYIFNYV